MKTKIFTFLSLAFFGLSTSNAQVGIGTNTPASSAILELQSSNKGFLPPRMTIAERDMIANPTEGLTIYNIDNKCLEFYNSDNDWISVCSGGVVTSPPPPPGPVIGANGREWLDRNLGASKIATSSTDADSYGDLYQWGRAEDGHEKRNSLDYNDVFQLSGVSGVANYLDDPNNAWYGKFIRRNSFDNNWVAENVTGVDDLWQGVSGINNPCPSDYRLPTVAELTSERDSWGSNNINAVGAINSPLHLPLTGRRLSNTSPSSLDDVGLTGYYWTSTIGSGFSEYFVFTANGAFFTFGSRSIGASVRCIKHVP